MRGKDRVNRGSTLPGNRSRVQPKPRRMLKPMDNGAFPAIVMSIGPGRGPCELGFTRVRHLLICRSRINPTSVCRRGHFEAHRMSELKDEFDPPFETLEPAEWRGPVVFNSPHSGNVYPRT